MFDQDRSPRAWHYKQMKTYKNLYPQIHTFANLYWAFRAARCGKQDCAAVAGFEFNLERNLFQLQEELSRQTYQPGAYTNFYPSLRRGLPHALGPASPPRPSWPCLPDQLCCGVRSATMD